VIDIIDKVAPSYSANKGKLIIDVRAAINDKVDKRNIERAALGLPPLKKPGKETVRLEVNRRLDRDTFREKWGESLAKSRWDGAGKTLRAHKILSVALIDDTTIDDILVMDGKRGLPLGRPYLCVILDVHSRCVLGFVVSFIPPTFHTAAECVKRANRPKSIRPETLNRYPVLSRIGGRMATLIADDGSNYASPAFQDALADVGITLQMTPVGTPTHKAMLERFFLTLNTWLLQKLPGATFNVGLMRELNYDPAKTAAITLVELELLIRQFIDVYHITVHSSIDMQPALKWQTSMDIHGRDIIADERKLEILMGVTKRDRRLYRGAIRMFGLSFRDRVLSADLNDSLVAAEPHRKRLKSGVVATVTVKYNPANLSHVHVRNHVTGEWVSLPCEDDEYAVGLSLWQHEQIRKWAKEQQLAFNTQEERLEARHGLNKRILELAPDRERRAVARMLGTPIDRADSSVLFGQAEPRHDGLAPAIEDGDIAHGTNEDRLDADIVPSRPLFEKKRIDATVDEDMLLDERADDDGQDGSAGVADTVGLAVEPIDDLLVGTDNEDDIWKEYEL
jgi:putative transposase